MALLQILTKVAADVLLDCPVYRLYILGCISAVFPALDLAGLPVARGLARVARIARDSLAIVGQGFPATAPRISFQREDINIHCHLKDVSHQFRLAEVVLQDVVHTFCILQHLERPGNRHFVGSNIHQYLGNCLVNI